MAGPRQKNMIPSRKNDIPMAVISGARRGALRSGRYATRSIATLIPPMTSITTGNTTSKARRLMTVKVPSVIANNPRRVVPMYAPSVNTSPWAKLISSMMP